MTDRGLRDCGEGVSRRRTPRTEAWAWTWVFWP